MPPKNRRKGNNSQNKGKKRNGNGKSKEKAQTESNEAVCESVNENRDGCALKQPQEDKKKSTGDGTDTHTPEQSGNRSPRVSENTNLEQQYKPEGQDAENMNVNENVPSRDTHEIKQFRKKSSAEGYKPDLRQQDKPEDQDAENVNVNKNDSRRDTQAIGKLSKESSAEGNKPDLEQQDKPEDQDAENMNVNENDSSRDTQAIEQLSTESSAEGNKPDLGQQDKPEDQDAENMNVNEIDSSRDTHAIEQLSTESSAEGSKPDLGQQDKPEDQDAENMNVNGNVPSRDTHEIKQLSKESSPEGNKPDLGQQDKPDKDEQEQSSNQTSSETKISVSIENKGNSVTGNMNFNEFDTALHKLEPSRNRASSHSDGTDSAPGDKTENPIIKKMDTKETDSRKETHEQMQPRNGPSAESNITGVFRHSNNTDIFQGDRTESQDINNINTKESLPSSETQETEQHGNGASADVDKTGILEDSDNNDSVDWDKTDSQETNNINTNGSLQSRETQEEKQHGNEASAVDDKTGMLEYSDNFSSEHGDSEHGDRTESQDTNNINKNKSPPSSETQEKQHGNEVSADDDITGILGDLDNNESVGGGKTDNQDYNNIRTNESLPISETQEEKQHGNLDGEGPPNINSKKSQLNTNEEELSGNQSSSETKTSVSIENAKKENSEIGDLSFNEFDLDLHKLEPSRNRASSDSDDTDSAPGDKTEHLDIKTMDTEETDSRKETHEQMQSGNGLSAESNITGVYGHSNNSNIVHGDRTESQVIKNIITKESLQSSETQETERHGNGASADFNKTGILDDSDINDSKHWKKTESQTSNKISTIESLPSRETQEGKQHRNGDFADNDKTYFFKDSDNIDSEHGDSEHGNKTYSQDINNINTSESHTSSKTQEEKQRGTEASTEISILQDSDNNDDRDETDNQETNNIRTNESLLSSEIQEENQHRNGSSADVDKSGLLDINDSEHGDGIDSQDVKEIKSNENNSMKATQESERPRIGAVGDSDRMGLELKMSCSEDQEGKNMDLDESHQSEETPELKQDSEDTKKTVSIENAKTGNHDTQDLISPESEKVEEGVLEDNGESQNTVSKTKSQPRKNQWRRKT
ncbi:uncharacterized protein DDB_G0290685-like [Saccostrea cucullata]|uniref:uncharacterized protein DDB_G0290685-like n=1 Tax=Saccostrea cuccullata TaxID=36930 RepID=UPI002ED24603